MKSTLENAYQILTREQNDRIGYGGSVQSGSVTLPLRGVATIVGDLHGDVTSLHAIIESSDFMAEASEKKDRLLIFLGDYGDRGIYGPELYYYVLTLKSKLPDQVILMRGNHEGPDDLPCYPYDLELQFEDRFGREGLALHQRLRELMQKMYHLVILENAYLLTHGGVPIGGPSLGDLHSARDDHPGRDTLAQLLWNDPREGLKGHLPSPRGCGYLFGADVTERMLHTTGANVLIRGHEPCDGVKPFHNGLGLTVFSCKGIYRNSKAAFLEIDSKMAKADELGSKAKFF
jgi:protein phosphatase